MKKILSLRKNLVLSTALLGGMTGCTTYVDGPRHARIHQAPPPVYVETNYQDDYVYYPGDQVYYSPRRHQYTYQEGRAWVTRPAPPRVSVDVLLAAPSVHLDFHDSPSRHHATVTRQYPRHWAPPPGRGSNHGPGNRDDDRRYDRDGRRF
ncbi:MAG: hypothetical protein ABIV39_13620 [Verrucomicrobiota bacterium]